MRTFHAHPRSTVYVGDCRDAMRDQLAPNSVHCVVTSPPYWGLRDYGLPPVEWEDGERCVFGLEETVEGYVRHTLEIFRGLDRVLREDGVIWWNIGDTFATGKVSMNNPGGGDTSLHNRHKDAGALVGGACPNRMPQSISPGNKCLIPYRVAIALQDAGWVIREDIVWSKPSPMPISVDGVRWTRCRVKVGREKTNWKAVPKGWDTGVGAHDDIAHGRYSVAEKREATTAVFAPCPGCDKCRATDGWILRRGRWRTTTSHEAILMITRPGSYFCDASAAAESAVGGSPGNATHKHATAYANGDEKHRIKAGLCDVGAVETRNPRSVWRIPSEPLKEKHFAAFPSALAWKCIQAATSSAGCCPQCGECYAPMVTKERVPTRPGEETKVSGDSSMEGNRDPQRHIQRTLVHGYRPTCACTAGDPVPAVVFDPFAGSGTTLQVAVHSGRIGIGCEMSEGYLDIQSRRIPQTPRCFIAKSAVKKTRRRKHAAQRVLFDGATP